jgi:ADP-dependent NAD(P)H-hydrate dehydratase / NAD(P)H-hydrate epimerase
MQAVDRFAIDRLGVPGLELMERAGLGVARAVEELAPDGPVVVCCGKGNNGGDGFVVARILRESGRAVHVLCSAPPAEYSGDARANLERLPGDAPAVLVAGEEPPAGAAPRTDERALAAGRELLAQPAVIVDALLGTGFAGVPRGAVAWAIEAINEAPAPVVSVDVPSGVDASTGVIAGAAVRASVTVTFQLGKPGLWIAPGKAHAGEVRTIEIGIPREALAEASTPADASAPAEELVLGLIEPSIADVLPRRGASSTKFSSGHVLVVGGSPGLTGAPRMCAHAAMRAGAGYVTACVPASLQSIVATAGTPEVMTRGLAEHEGSLTEEAVEAVLAASDRGGSLALGTGLGRDERAFAFARALARAARVPAVIDADGLNAHAGRLEELAAREAPTVLTPHAGELGRLLELPSEEIERERLRHAREAAERAGAVVVLKGDDTLVVKPDGLIAISRGDSPALATAGTGDVLSGVISATLATGVEAFAAAAAGVWLHAAAGREAARRQGAAEGVIATDVIAALPVARGREELRWQ